MAGSQSSWDIVAFTENTKQSVIKRKIERDLIESIIYTKSFLEGKEDLVKIFNSLHVIDFEADRFYKGDVLGLQIFLEPNNKKVLSKVIADFEKYGEFYTSVFQYKNNTKIFYTAGILDFYRLNFNKVVKLKNKRFK